MVIGTVVDAMGIVPYPVLTKIIVINNTIAGWIGVILLTTVFGFVRDTLNLFWADVLDEEYIGRPLFGPAGAWLVCLATLFGLSGIFHPLRSSASAGCHLCYYRGMPDPLKRRPPVPTAITIEDLTFTYRKGNRPALEQLNGTVPRPMDRPDGKRGGREIIPLFRLNGLIPHFFRGRYQGRVMVGGRDPARTKVPEMSRRVGLVLQDFETQLFSTSVELEMVFGLENMGLPRGEMEARVQKYLEWVGLEKMRQREPASLSGGEKQRLAIGAVLAMEPDFLVLDEPTTDLDPAGRQAVYEIITHWRNLGKTLVLVEQDPDVILEADQLWVIQEGELKAVGIPETLFRKDSFAEQGLQRPALMELFHLLGWEEGPLTVDEAEVLIRGKTS